MTLNEQKSAAKAFAERWKGRGYEKGESQSFWIDLLQSVFGIGTPVGFISFENQVKLSSTSFIDAYIEPTHTLIEQKSIDKDLFKKILQSDGTLLTPFQQAKRYAAELPYSKRPRWMVICNFREFHVYDMENPQGEPEVILLENLEKEYYRLQFLVDQGNEHLRKEMEVSLKAGEIIGKIYDGFLKQYINPEDPQTLKSLNILCVRLVFCLYAEDAGLFGEKRCMFHDYLAQFKPGRGEMRKALIELFEVLNTPVEERDPYLDDSLRAFPYCNGGLFAERNIEIPRFNDELAELVLKHASDDFDWSEISPTIFGAVFESTLNPETRRKGGMHYTSIENIHKVIDPLFLDDLTAELENIEAEPVEKKRIQKAKEYQDKLASLKFLDPACGSGNFLTETYLSLRRLENRAIAVIAKGSMILNLGEEYSPIKVNIHQFYGIEINDFAVATATTALWIAEAQMMMETEKLINVNLDFLPLKSYNNIIEGNALRMDWNNFSIPDDEITTIIAGNTHLYRTQPQGGILQEPTFRYGDINLYTENMDFNPCETKSIHVDFDYIIGNPPFVGARWMSKDQKADVIDIFGAKWPGVGDLDYVCCWYKKAADYIKGTKTRCALVSTNSITQGSSVANLWKPLMEEYGVHIDFAWRTFRWDSEASVKAHVHCVIIGFSTAHNGKSRTIFQENGEAVLATNISPYLVDADNVFVESRKTPLSAVPEIGIGNKPIDGGNFLFTKAEMEEFVKLEPASQMYFHPWYGSEEFIHRSPRYCLWLGNCSPAILHKMPRCLQRIENVRTFRLKSSSAPTRKLADTPSRFHVENMPANNYMLIPKVSSEKRCYVPMGMMTPNVLCSDLVFLIPGATFYHLGVLTSSVHMAWMRAVCGRLEMRYRYSKDVVYNNFPWPTPTEAQKAKIEATAQAILDARALYPDCSLADLYDELTMPVELRKAHQANDKAVMEAYGFRKDMSESEIVAELFKMYQELTEK